MLAARPRNMAIWKDGGQGGETAAEESSISGERERRANQGYEGSDDEHGIEEVILEGEEGQAHVGEDEVLCQEVQEFKELRGDKRRRKRGPQTDQCSNNRSENPSRGHQSCFIHPSKHTSAFFK